MTDNDYRIEDGSEKGRPNYTLRRVKFAAAVVGLVVSVTLMLTWHGGLTCVLSSCYRPMWREFSFRKSGRF